MLMRSMRALRYATIPRCAANRLAVAGSSRRAVVLTASYEARPFGVHSAMPLYRALQACPGLIVVRPDYQKYRDRLTSDL